VSFSKSSRFSIFLSHTSELGKYPEDISYVAKAKEAIESAGHIVVDMATFRAQSKPAEEYDTQRVKDCDVYIGLYGNRYGSLTSEKISHTESEYNAALAAGLPRFIFLLDQDSADIGLPLHALQHDRYTGKRRTFLKRVSKEVIYKLFGNRDHLYSLISDVLHDLAETKANDSLAGQEPIDPVLVPFQFSAYRKQRAKGFVGREWLFERVRNWLRDCPSSQGLLLTAGFGVGKTAFIAKLVENNSTGLPLAAQHFCQGGQNTTLSPGRFVASIAAQLAEAVPAYRRRLQAADAVVPLDLLKNASQQPEDAWNQAVVALLHEIEEPGIDHLLVIDALELTLQYRPAVGEPDNIGIPNLLAADTPLPRWLRILATSRNDEEVLTTLTARLFYHNQIREDDADNLNDLRTYTEARCQTDSLRQVLSRASLSSLQVAKKLCEPKLSGGKLLYIASVLDGVENGMIQLTRLRDLDRLPAGMSEFYKHTFRRSYPRPRDSDHYKLMRSILGLLCEQREPLSLSELSAILSVPKKQIRTELLNLGSLISTHRIEFYRDVKLSSDVFFSFDHSSLRLWLTDGAESGGIPLSDPYDIDLNEARDLIQSWALKEVSVQNTHQWPYLVRHMSSYIKPEEWLACRNELLCNIHWLQARLAHTSINQLMLDADGVSQDALAASSSSLSGFLGQAEQTLRLYPQQLPTQILARLDKGSPIANIAGLCQAAEQICKQNQLAIPLFPSLNNSRLLRQASISAAILSLCYNEAQQLVLFGCKDGRVGVWSLRAGSISYSEACSGRNNVVSAITEVSNSRFASATWDGKVIIWTLEDLNQVGEVQAHDEAINALVSCRVDGKNLLVSASDDQSIRVWQLPQYSSRGKQQKFRRLHAIDSAHHSWVTHLVYLGGCEVASASKDGTVAVWNIREGKRKWSTQLEGEVISLSAPLSSQSLYVVTDPGENLANLVYRIDLGLDQCEQTASLPDDIQSLLCTGISDTLFFYSESQGCMIFSQTWNEPGLEHRRLGGHDALIECLCQSSGNQPLLVSASINRDQQGQLVSTIAIWDSSDHASVAGASPSLVHHGGVLLIQSTNPDEVFSVAADGSGILWSAGGLPQTKWRFFDHANREIVASSQAYFLTEHQLTIRNGTQLLFYDTPVNRSIGAKLQLQSCSLTDKAEWLELSPTAAVWSDVYGLVLGCADGSILYAASHSTTETLSSRVVIGSFKFMKMLDPFRLFCWTSLSSEDGSYWICELDKPHKDFDMLKDQQSSAIVSRVSRIKSEDITPSSHSMITSGKLELLHVCDEYLAIAHADASVSIWEWENDFQELSFKHRLLGHSLSAVAILILGDGSYITASADRTIRRWKQHEERMIGTIIFVNDYIPTTLYAVAQDSVQGRPSTMMIVGDEMGLLHWLQLS
jgi:WD40 repeat protein